MPMTIEDVEKLQNLYPDYQIELRDGSITIVSPSDATSGFIGAEFSRVLGNWVRPRKLGYIFDSSSGFRSPNGDLTAPDVSFISRARLKQVPRTYAEIVPDLVVEVKSSTDRIKPLVEKLQTLLASGSKVGILIDPDKQTLTIYRPAQQPIVFGNGEVLTLPELLPGWELNVSELWPQEFDAD